MLLREFTLSLSKGPLQYSHKTTGIQLSILILIVPDYISLIIKSE